MKLQALLQSMTLAGAFLTSSCIIAVEGSGEDWASHLSENDTPVKENPVEIAIRNRHNLNKLSPGMSIEAVHETMGKTTLASARIANPYRSESFPIEAAAPVGTESRAQVFFYYTENRTRDGQVEYDELTPVWFEDGRLLGWGRAAFDIWKRKTLGS